MTNVGKHLREETIAEGLAMTLDERIQVAFALGDEAVRLFAQMNDLSTTEAESILDRNRQKGRRVSGCLKTP